MNTLVSWLVLILAVLCAIGIMRVINALQNIKDLFTDEPRRK